MIIILCGTSKGFIKALTTFIKCLKVPQRSIKIKTYVIFLFQIIFLMLGAIRFFDEYTKKNKTFQTLVADISSKYTIVNYNELFLEN